VPWHGQGKQHPGDLGDHEQPRFGTIAGLGEGALRHDLRHRFEVDGETYSPDYAAIARLWHRGITINKADELLPALQKAIALKKPVVIDVYMKNIPTPTAGHWNIMDIYSPGKKVHHVSTD
jgi:acetolactate synthase, large subunit (EC 2.2.1.6)